MTDRTFTLTLEEIKCIYQAGIRRGNDEATAYEWGSRASGDEYDECVEALQDIVNIGFKWGDVGYTDYKVVEGWFKENR